MTDALCDLDKLSKWLCLILFILGFFTCKFILSAKTNHITEEEHSNKQKEMLKYFNEHKKDTEEFFMNSSFAS